MQTDIPSNDDLRKTSKELNGSKRDNILRRNQFLIELACCSTLSISQIVNLKIWQLTYFVIRDNMNIRRRSCDFMLRDLCVGLYIDRNYSTISPLKGISKPMINAYFNRINAPNGNSYLFPRSNRSKEMNWNKHISVSNAHKILKKFFGKTGKAINWHKIRHNSICYSVSSGNSVKQTSLDSGLSLQQVRRIVDKYDVFETNKQNNTIFYYRGIMISNSSLSRFETTYPRRILPMHTKSAPILARYSRLF